MAAVALEPEGSGGVPRPPDSSGKAVGSTAATHQIDRDDFEDDETVLDGAISTALFVASILAWIFFWAITWVPAVLCVALSGSHSKLEPSTFAAGSTPPMEH